MSQQWWKAKIMPLIKESNLLTKLHTTENCTYQVQRSIHHVEFAKKLQAKLVAKSYSTAEDEI